MTALITGNKVNASIVGPHSIKFNDGTIIQFHPGKFTMSGILMGRRLFNYEGNFIARDLTNNLICVFELNPKDERGFFSKLFSSSNSEHFPDYFKGFIAEEKNVKYCKKTDKYSVEKEAILSNAEGEFTNYINFDGKPYWENGSMAASKIGRQNYTLQSDSLFRNDLILFKQDKIEMAQYAKMTLEDVQRKDAKLRKAFSSKQIK